MVSRRLRLSLLVAVLAAGLVLWQRQNIQDWLQLHGYQAPAAVSQLADQTTLTPKARKAFYVNHPSVEDRASFNGHCSNQGEQTIVLGCYHSFDDGIYIFQVTDSRLDGVEQVTAAHEMLHAAYDRLGSRQRADVDTQLEDYYRHGLQDERIRATIAAYQKTEPHDLMNEMHSIFGTEVADLPAPLETYYKQYFSDRSRVVGYAQSYQQVFTSRQQQAQQLLEQISVLKGQLTALNQSLVAGQKQLSSSRGQVHGQTETDQFNEAVTSYNAGVDREHNLVAQYNQLVDKYNGLVVQENELAQAIDSRSQPSHIQ